MDWCVQIIRSTNGDERGVCTCTVEACTSRLRFIACNANTSTSTGTLESERRFMTTSWVEGMQNFNKVLLRTHTTINPVGTFNSDFLERSRCWTCLMMIGTKSESLLSRVTVWLEPLANPCFHTTRLMRPLSEWEKSIILVDEFLWIPATSVFWDTMWFWWWDKTRFGPFCDSIFYLAYDWSRCL